MGAVYLRHPLGNGLHRREVRSAVRRTVYTVADQDAAQPGRILFLGIGTAFTVVRVEGDRSFNVGGGPGTCPVFRRCVRCHKHRDGCGRFFSASRATTNSHSLSCLDVAGGQHQAAANRRTHSGDRRGICRHSLWGARSDYNKHWLGSADVLCNFAIRDMCRRLVPEALLREGGFDQRDAFPIFRGESFLAYSGCAIGDGRSRLDIAFDTGSGLDDFRFIHGCGVVADVYDQRR